MQNLLDSDFIQLHNFSVDIYQTFKGDVDLLFSGTIPIQEQSHFISVFFPFLLNFFQRILLHMKRLSSALESEKQYLMGNVLCPWAIQQQKMSIATQWTQQMNYNLLENIDLE